jgi:sugar lactone lactonase YvrE
VLKDIWTASPYASAGLCVTDTDTPGRIYAISSEHHVRNEVIFRNVSNWNVLALQLEEEVSEGSYCLPVELDRCHALRFGNLYLFRTIWLDNPYPQAIKTWECRGIELLNVHNFTQVKYTIDNTLFDVTTNTQVRPFQLARLAIAEKPAAPVPVVIDEKVRKLAEGFEFIDTVCRDSKGNVYFADSRWKRIYRWSAEKNALNLVTELHFRPLSLACDTKDNLLVCVEYFPPRGATVAGKPESYPKPDDARGTAYGTWYNTGSTVKAYAIDPAHPETSMQVLKTAPMGAGSIAKPEKVLYPGNRWRDNNDYLTITTRKPAECFVAPDGVTIIPVTYDLIRATSLLEARPGQAFFAADEYYKRTVRFNVGTDGTLSDPKVFANRGEYNLAVDPSGNVYVPDGEIAVFSKTGELLKEIAVPERPACVVFAGADGKTLFITARSSLYAVRP